jgi:hypothetical protein
MLKPQESPDIDVLIASGTLIALGAQEPQPFRVGDEVRSKWRYDNPWIGVVTDVQWSWHIDVWYRKGSYELEETLRWFWLVEVRLVRSKHGVPIRKRWVRRSAVWFTKE